MATLLHQKFQIRNGFPGRLQRIPNRLVLQERISPICRLSNLKKNLTIISQFSPNSNITRSIYKEEFKVIEDSFIEELKSEIQELKLWTKRDLPEKLDRASEQISLVVVEAREKLGLPSKQEPLILEQKPQELIPQKLLSEIPRSLWQKTSFYVKWPIITFIPIMITMGVVFGEAGVWGIAPVWVLGPIFLGISMWVTSQIFRFLSVLARAVADTLAEAYCGTLNTANYALSGELANDSKSLVSSVAHKIEEKKAEVVALTIEKKNALIHFFVSGAILQELRDLSIRLVVWAYSITFGRLVSALYGLSTALGPIRKELDRMLEKVF